MTQEELTAIGLKWINSWNKRDLESLLKIVSDSSRLAEIHSFFEPIFFEQTELKGKNYLRARFVRDFKILDKSKIEFKDPYKITTGDFFVDMEYKMSNDLYVHEVLSLSETGEIEQVYRNIDTHSFS